MQSKRGKGANYLKFIAAGAFILSTKTYKRTPESRGEDLFSSLFLGPLRTYTCIWITHVSSRKSVYMYTWLYTFKAIQREKRRFWRAWESKDFYGGYENRELIYRQP